MTLGVVFTIFASCRGGCEGPATQDAGTDDAHDAALTDAATADAPAGDAIAVDTGRADSSNSDSAAGDAATGDAGGPAAACRNAVHLDYQGGTLVYQGDDTDLPDDCDFASCGSSGWSYPCPDVVHWLDAPVGIYQVSLVPDRNYTYFSLFEVRAPSCEGFAGGCQAVEDAQLAATTLRINVQVEPGTNTYLVIDSALDPWIADPTEYSGGYTLSVTSTQLGDLGEACSSSLDCADDMACFDADDSPPGYCTDQCVYVDCQSATIDMSCRDISDHPSWPEGTEACVADSEIGVLGEHADCGYNYTCQSDLCVVPAVMSIAMGECRTPCTDTCPQGQSCVDITASLFQPPQQGQVKVCADNAEVNAAGDGEACVYSYQCQGELSCYPGDGTCG